MNTIPEDQMKPRALDMLKAQNRIYAKAKSVHFWQIAIVTAIPVMCSLAASKLGRSIQGPFASYWSLLAVAAQFMMSRWQQSLRSKAAKIQEIFDCDVLRLPWHELKAGSRHEEEAITQAATAYKSGGLEDWYPKRVGTLPLELARIVCQRANCWWDGNLRRRYARWALVTVVALLLVGAVAFLWRASTLAEAVLFGLVPLAPIFLLGITEWWDQERAASRSDELKAHAERIWDKALSGQYEPAELTRLSRDLQDEIYDNRKNNSQIFEWAYKRLRRPFEDNMNHAAEELANQAEAVSKSRNGKGTGAGQ